MPPFPRDDNHARTADLAASLKKSRLISPRRVAVALGMHRSGTSLAAQALQALGANLGGPLMTGDERNAEGYFEHLDIYAAQDEALAAMGVAWDACWSTLDTPPALSKRRRAGLGARLKAILERETGAGLFAFKDPRTLRFLPLWREVFVRNDIAPIWLLCVRDPRAVAASLWSRDRIPKIVGEWLWLEHVLEALTQLGPEIGRIVVYERWSSDPKAQMRTLAKAIGAKPCPSPFRADLAHQKPKGAAALPVAAALYAELTAPAPDLARLQVQARALRRRISA